MPRYLGTCIIVVGKVVRGRFCTTQAVASIHGVPGDGKEVCNAPAPGV